MERTLMHVASAVVPTLVVAPGASQTPATGRMGAMAEADATSGDAMRQNPGAGDGTAPTPSRWADGAAVRSNPCGPRRWAGAPAPDAARRVEAGDGPDAPHRTCPGTPPSGPSVS